MAQKTLRDLARDYARGTLDRETYRQSRASLIEGILAGEVAVPNRDFPAPVAPREPTGPREITQRRPRRNRPGAPPERGADVTSVVTEPDRVTRPVAPDAPAQPAPSVSPVRRGRVVVLALAVALVAAVAVYLGRPGVAPDPGNSLPAGPTVAASDPAALELIRNFLAQRSWTGEDMDTFLAQWHSLSDTQRASAAGSVELTQLANAIYRQVIEERALSGLGEETEGLARQQELIGFATAVGIEDARLKATSP